MGRVTDHDGSLKPRGLADGFDVIGVGVAAQRREGAALLDVGSDISPVGELTRASRARASSPNLGTNEWRGRRGPQRSEDTRRPPSAARRLI